MSVLPRHVAVVSNSAQITYSQVSAVAAALQKQVTRDFGPIWGVNGTVDGFEKLEDVPVDYWPVILQDDIKEPGAAGYHTDKNGQPFSLVQVDSSWPLTTSHETLEMLADPFGNRTVAGSPPPQAPKPIQALQRVLYLVEVADPCEDNPYAYSVNGIKLSDFITPHYYDPTETSTVRYSFGGHVKGPHRVLNNGYVSFGDPVTNEWYQILVEKNVAKLVKLGKLNTRGKSLRETIDGLSRQGRKASRYRLKPLAMEAGAAAAAGTASSIAASSDGRAQMLRAYIKKL